MRSAASIMASVKEQEARFERLTRALEEERRNVTLQLDRSTLPPDRLAGSQPLAWQQMVMQVTWDTGRTSSSTIPECNTRPLRRLRAPHRHRRVSI